jgi:hypothetical protein
MRKKIALLEISGFDAPQHKGKANRKTEEMPQQVNAASNGPAIYHTQQSTTLL